MKSFSHNSYIQLLQSWEVFGRHLPLAGARGYSNLALSEPAVIIIEEYVIRTYNDGVNSKF